MSLILLKCEMLKFFSSKNVHTKDLEIFSQGFSVIGWHKTNLYSVCIILSIFKDISCSGVHGGLERVNLQKKIPGSDTYIFDMYIPLGIKTRPNENIRSMS